MSNDNHREPNEDRLAALLRSIDADAPAPDAALLAAIGQRAAAAFAETSSSGTNANGDLPSSAAPVAEFRGTPGAAGTTDNLGTLSPPPTINTAAPAPRTKTMFTLALRSLVGLVASAAAVVMWFGLAPNNSAVGATPFSKVLQELREAKTLQLRVSKNGQSADVWVRAPGLVRREETPQRYQIAAGSRLWDIDETQNSSVASDSPWFISPENQIDLLGLLDVGVKDASALLRARPVERISRDGKDCFVYRVELPAKGHNLEVEAVADAKTLQLLDITARAAGTKRQGGPPLAELTLVAFDPAVGDDKFVVAKSLTEDGRIGKVSASQGIVVLRPMLAKRWTPICREMLLKPGDWLRTELRGANAAKIAFSSEVELTLGPGTLVECVSPTQVRLHHGQVQVMSPKKLRVEENVPFTLLAPRAGQRLFNHGEKQLVRIDRDEKIVDVPQTPVWLAGFEGTTSNESLGSLIVNLPDGRNEPLTVGYHKVSVEIRDQIARTTIEESFVNHTINRLEGIFHFPLPQDASISGFGMWIGNDLIEADVVEKQRAREIYETILIEKRDPGLLEWTGGNIFKARVFPIEGRSEKRIKIVYTQVLPLRANRYRYSYGLRSEMLRTKPLRELSLSVMVNSALPLKSISCPTHAVRSQHAGHSGQVEFTAQEYTPTRDFEVVCEVDGKQSDVVVIPHRRGNDGYFLMQLTPPAPDGNWQRELLPDGKPLNLILLCDTSSSMDSEKRKQQSEFVASVLSSLGTEDRFQLAAADVGTVWAFGEPVAPNAENVTKAKGFLDERISLGWTNLDRAFSEVVKKATANSQVIYIGDGIVSAGDTDPAAFVQRLGQIIAHRDPKSKEANRPTFHAVTVGNTNESVVLKGIATVGGGSVRTIGGEQTPQIVALELLNEVAQPGLRDINVEFRGLKVAAVYPGRLPNVAAGTQQILVGRYLPEGKDQIGEVRVSGQRGTETVRFAAKIQLKDAEEGNSFIPRLWARAHLDQLLAQGSSGAIRDEIIRMSEEFHIITPYTSLLVLETDADRVRFGVQRRYEMRDGERFFAAGRENANYDLLQQQMKRAGDWRLGMRRQVLRSLSGLGRNQRIFQLELQSMLGRLPAGSAGYALDSLSADSGPMSGPWGGGAGGRGSGSWSDDSGLGVTDLFSETAARGMRMNLGDDEAKKDGISEVLNSVNVSDFGAEIDGGVAYDKESGAVADRKGSLEKSLDEAVSFDELNVSLGVREEDETRGGVVISSFAKRKASRSDVSDRDLSDLGDSSMWEEDTKRLSADKVALIMDGTSDVSFDLHKSIIDSGRISEPYYRNRYTYNQPDYTSWVNTLFPALEPPPGKHVRRTAVPTNWTPEALALAKSLLRVDGLLKLDGGIELSRVSDHLDPRWKRQSGRSSDLALYSPTAWLTRGRNLREQTYVSYCNATERGVYSLAFLLGRNRASVASELQVPPLGLIDYSLANLSESYPSYSARVEPAGENQLKLILTTKDSTHVEHFTIDTARHVLLKREWFDDSKAGGSMSYEDFVELAGSWWATKIITVDNQGRPTSETTLGIKLLAKEQYAERMNAELAAKPSVQFVRLPFVSLAAARQKVADGTAAFDDRLAMILHNAQLQQWDEMWKHVEAAEKLDPTKLGVRWLRTQLYITIRRNEEARQRLLAEVRQLVAKPQQDELFLAGHILDHAYGLTGWPEFLEFVQLIKPVYERPLLVDGKVLSDLSVMQSWTERLAQCMENLGRPEEALVIRRSLAEAAPWHLHWQDNFARRLANSGQFDAAHAWLRQELARPERNADEIESLSTIVADLYRQQAQWAELLKWTTAWIARNPESASYNSAYAQHLSALIFNDQLDNAYQLSDQWLKEARVEGKLTATQRAKLETALNFANSSLPGLNFNRTDPRWFEPLAETARFFLRHKHHFEFVQRCVSNHYFSQSDLSDKLRGEWLTLLRTDLANLPPLQTNTLVGWTLSGRMELTEPLNGRKQLDASEIPDEIWQTIATAIKPRWEAATDKNDKHLLGETLRTIYATRFNETLLLPFLRERIASAPADYKTTYVTTLFDTLLTTKWSEAIEQEAFARLHDLSDAKDPATWLQMWSDVIEPEGMARWREIATAQARNERLTVELPALLRLVDAMLASRVALATEQLNDLGGQDKLTRQELAAKKAELLKTAQLGLAARLADEARKEDGPLADWMQIERMWLEVRLNENLAQVEADCWKILGDTPPKPAPPGDDQEQTAEKIAAAEVRARQGFFEALLKRRAFATLQNLAVRKQAAPASIDRLLKYIDAGIAQNAPAVPPTEDGYRERASFGWKLIKFRMLVALDRPDDLDRELREWARTAVSTAPWRQMLAHLVAERGKLDEAIQLLEACQKDKLLSAGDYRLLADWYLVVNRRADYERSRIESYKLIPEGNLSNLIYRTRNLWYSDNPRLPSELDENTLFIFKALFEKSAQPENYLHQLRDLYAACRDFRLLQMLPDAALGRSPQQVYAFLENLQSQVLYELRNEATADEILSRVKKLREGERTPTDLRALDLLEALVERKSSEILNQPGPHVDACLAALQRAFKRDWTPGEPRMMSHLLRQLGGLPNEKLKAEQIRELRELQKLAPEQSRDHLMITDDLCYLLFSAYGLRDETLREMEVEVTAYTQANKGIWPQTDSPVLSHYISMFEDLKRHAAGEIVLQQYLKQPENDEQTKWLKDRLLTLYNDALEDDGAVSIGTGRAKLLGPLVALTLKELDASSDEYARYNYVTRLNSTFTIAHNYKVPGTSELVKSFAFEKLPVLLKHQQQNYRNTATMLTHIIGEVLGPQLALQYVVERMEQYPQRLEIQWDHTWNAFGAELAQRRLNAGSNNELDPRVLKLAISRLKRDLREGETSAYHLYNRNHQHFWGEKLPDFAKAAEEVLSERRTSGRQAMVVATYLHDGLAMLPRAIEILLIAHKQGILEENSQVQLARWLREANRFAEQIPILEPLVAARPDNINYRTELMVAYFQSKRPEQLAELIQQTNAYFHDGGRWTEATVAQFGRGCHGTEQWERMAACFTEAIVLHQRGNPASGRNDATLSDYYQHLALAESKLNHTTAAVTAASAAIVCWDARHENRGSALNSLKSVLAAAQDLNDYVAALDAETAKTGQDSPVLRKALGQTYQARAEHARAITQYKLALALQPNDTETHQGLIACYDATQDAAAATRQLLQLIDLHRHDLALYQKLAERMNDNEPEAERAATSIIEAAPNEAESHAAMAELRQQQNRWAEAIPHWQQVSQLRRLEPTGLLKLAEAQLHEKQWPAAKQTLQKLQHTEWPSRFNNVDQQTQQLLQQLPKE